MLVIHDRWGVAVCCDRALISYRLSTQKHSFPCCTCLYIENCGQEVFRPLYQPRSRSTTSPPAAPPPPPPSPSSSLPLTHPNFSIRSSPPPSIQELSSGNPPYFHSDFLLLSLPASLPFPPHPTDSPHASCPPTHNLRLRNSVNGCSLLNKPRPSSPSRAAR